MKDLSKLEKALIKLTKGIDKKHLAVLSADLAETLKNKIERSFEEQKAPDGTPWKPRQGGKDPARKILYKSGNLSNSWATESSATHFRAFNPARSKDGFAYGLAHQFGIKTKQGKVARRFLPLNKDNTGLNDETAQELLAEVEEYFTCAVRNAFK